MWQLGKKLVGRKIFSKVKLEGEKLAGGWWSVPGGTVGFGSFPTRPTKGHVRLSWKNLLRNLFSMNQGLSSDLFPPPLRISLVFRKMCPKGG